MTAPRWVRFYIVGAAGIAVQTGVFAALAMLLHAHYLVATALAVEAAVLHNFAWHRRWTWADRQQARLWPQLLRFHLSTGLISILVNLLAMRLLAGLIGLHPAPAVLLTIAAASAVNYIVADQAVFVPRATP